MINTIIGAIVVGLSLGFFGSGGSIMTVPVLLYVVGMEPEMAIAASLIVVAFIALSGASFHIFKRNISWPHVFLFGIPGMIGTYGGAWLGAIVDSKVQLTVFVILMLVAAVLMWKPKENLKSGELKVFKVMLDGVVVGVITGFVGVGGGFLIVPALVLLGGIAMNLAIGTSLMIIALKSFAGFYKYYDVLTSANVTFDWNVIMVMSLGGIIGTFIGSKLSQKLDTNKLQKGFSVFLVFMGSFVLIRSVIMQ